MKMYYGCLALNVVFAGINFYQGSYVWGAINVALVAYIVYPLVRR